MTITHSSMNLESIKELISQRVAEALAAQEANRNAGLVDESQSQNGDDDDNGNGGNRDHDNNNGDGNQNGGNEGARRNASVAKAYTYKDFLNYQPRNFSGTEGVVGLARWFEKMELTIGIDESSYEMPWKDLMKLMIDLYATIPVSCIAMSRMVSEEIDKLRGSLWGLPDNIQSAGKKVSLITQSTRIPHSPIFPTQFSSVLAAHFKRQNVAQAFTVDNNEKRRYAGSAPYCNECRLHHEGPCTDMVASHGWSFASAVPGQMTHLVAISTLDSANSCVMQGASCTQRAVSMVIFGRISPNSFLSSMLLLVVIIVMVVFVVVIWVVIFVNVIVGVIIVVVFGIVVVVPLVPVFLLGLLALAIDAACAFRAEEMPSLISCRMAAKVMAGVSDVDVLLGGILSTKDNA
ncbi:hypothetical protein Tco_0530492 [Tanacetum coccineum]